MTSTMFKKLTSFDYIKLKIFQPIKNRNSRGLFGRRSRRPQQKTQLTSIIEAKTTIRGNVSGEENLRIEGKLEGTVNLPRNHVIVGETGQVIADITANIATLDGDTKGEIKAVERVIISNTGRIRGSISSPRVVLEDGGKFTGRIDMNLTEGKKVKTARKVPVKETSSQEPDEQVRKPT